jgi:yeast amino acid transporter
MSSVNSKDKDGAEIDVIEIAPAQKKERGFWTRMAHSFRRKTEAAGHELALGDADMLREAGDITRLNRKLKTRHLQMIAIGGSIGCGLFIGSGSALKAGGPGAVVLDFCIIGLMMFCTVNAMGELATLFPVQGIFLV